MPAQRDSLRLTDTYREHLGTLRDRATRLVVERWRLDITDLERTHDEWLTEAVVTIETAQRAGVRLTAAYLAAFLTSELRHRQAPPPVDEEAYAGISRDGKPLAETLAGTLVTVKAALGEGIAAPVAFERGLSRAVRLTGAETLASPRSVLADQIRDDDRIIGWRRVTTGGCGACLAAATRTYGPDESLRVHDGCRCGAEPIVAGVRDTIHRPDGHEIFNAMTPEQQDQSLGIQTAALVRAGQVALRDLIAVSPMRVIDDQITQRPLQDALS